MRRFLIAIAALGVLASCAAHAPYGSVETDPVTRNTGWDPLSELNTWLTTVSP